MSNYDPRSINQMYEQYSRTHSSSNNRGSTYDEVPQTLRKGLGTPLTGSYNVGGGDDDDDDKKKEDVGGTRSFFENIFDWFSASGAEPKPPERYDGSSLYSREEFKPFSYDPTTKTSSITGYIPDSPIRSSDDIMSDVDAMLDRSDDAGYTPDPALGSTYDEVKNQDRPPVTIEDAINAAIENTIPTEGYTVQRGDTLSEIAAATGRTVKELQQLNNITDPRKMQAGSTLKIPVQTAQDKEIVAGAKKMSDLKPIRASNQSMMTGDQREYAPETGFEGMGPDPSTGKGIMSPPGGYDEGPLKELGLMTSRRVEPTDAITAATKEKTDFVNTFVERMGSTDEGRQDHTDNLGITTLGYGVLPATARALGYDPDSEEYQDREKLAKAVYADMYDNARQEYPSVFNNVTMDQAQGVLSMYINLGEIPDSVENALSRSPADFEAARDGLSRNILGSPRNNDGSRKTENGKVIFTSNKGLSKRRAREYNTLMEGDPDYKPIRTVSVEGTRANPIFVWKDADGNEVHRYSPDLNNTDVVYKGLDSSNTMTDVRVD